MKKGVYEKMSVSDRDKLLRTITLLNRINRALTTTPDSDLPKPVRKKWAFLDGHTRPFWKVVRPRSPPDDRHLVRLRSFGVRWQALDGVWGLLADPRGTRRLSNEALIFLLKCYVRWSSIGMTERECCETILKNR